MLRFCRLVYFTFPRTTHSSVQTFESTFMRPNVANHGNHHSLSWRRWSLRGAPNASTVRPESKGGGPPDMLICGGDAEAKGRVAVLKDFDFRRLS